MYDYLALLFGVVALLGLKAYLTNRAYENKKNYYQDPSELASQIMNKKQREMLPILEKIYDVNHLNLLFVRNLSILKEEWERIKRENSKDCDLLCERYRQIAILLTLMVSQHQKEDKKSVLKNKVKFLEKTYNQYKKDLDEIKEAMDEQKYFTKPVCKTIANYSLDISDIFGKYR